MTTTQNREGRLKFVADTLTRMLRSSHIGAPRHSASECDVCRRYESRDRIQHMLERRETLRVIFHARTIGDTGSGRFETDLLDLSAAGAFLNSVLPFPEHQALTLRFKLGSSEITVPAEVCYSIQHVGFGVRFVDLREEDRKRIEQFVRIRASRS